MKLRVELEKLKKIAENNLTFESSKKEWTEKIQKFNITIENIIVMLKVRFLYYFLKFFN